MDLEQAIEHAIDGNAVLFLGAGFSVGATGVSGKPFRTGRELAADWASLLGLPGDTALDVVAEEFAHQLGEDALLTELQRAFTVNTVADYHTAVASLPWQVTYTTNYDNVFETSSARVGRVLTSVTLTDNARSVPRTNPRCIHLNGFVGRLERGNLQREFKLTEGSYLADSVSASPWAVAFRRDLETAQAVVFLGYSLYDLDVQRLLVETGSLKTKTFFLVGTTPSPVVSRRAARFGQVLSIDTSMFAEAIRRKQTTYSAPASPKVFEHCLRRFELPATGRAAGDRDMLDLVLRGELRLPLLAGSLFGGNKYYLERPAVEGVLTAIGNGARAVAVHGELANGKTLLLNGIAARGVGLGYRVVFAHTRSESLLREAAALVAANVKTIVIIDDYNRWWELIEYIRDHGTDRFHLVFAARSSLHDVLLDRLLDAIGLKSIPEFNIDALTAADIDWLVVAFDEYGFWGDGAAWGHARKHKYLRRAAGGQFHGILLKLLSSPDVIARFSTLVDYLQAKGTYYEVTIAVLALTILDFRPSIGMLADLFGEVITESNFRRDAAITDLVDFSDGVVRMKSSVASQVLLSKVADPNVVIDVLIRLAKAADNATSVDYLYQALLDNLMRFSNLQMLLPERGRRLAILHFYESTKTLARCRRHPLFWLQYAIAALTLDELDRAGLYFDTAYSFADAREFDAFQIDNHYARYLLVKAMRLGEPLEAMPAFRKAQAIIERQLRQERKHFPFGIAANYLPFYERFKSDLDNREREEIARAAEAVLRRVEELPAERRAHYNVVKGKEAANAILSDMAAGPAPRSRVVRKAR